MFTTNYSANPDNGVPGLVAYMGNVERHTETASADISLGKGMARVSGGKVKVIDGEADVLVGVSVLKQTNVSGTPYVENDPVISLRKGSVWMKATADVAKGDHAYIDVTNGDATNVSTGNVDTKGIFDSDALDGELVIVSINLPNA